MTLLLISSQYVPTFYTTYLVLIGSFQNVSSSFYSLMKLSKHFILVFVFFHYFLYSYDVLSLTRTTIKKLANEILLFSPCVCIIFDVIDLNLNM